MEIYFIGYKEMRIYFYARSEFMTKDNNIDGYVSFSNQKIKFQPRGNYQKQSKS